MSIDKSTTSINIEDEMRHSYIDYAMSVIIGRALPDVRDGLKHVHRRILFAQSELGNEYNKSHRKCAKVVGEVMGNYHPHGDAAIYETLVRMAQDFSMRYPLEDGQGNFGSIDGDPAAAYRYTEVRMTKISSEMLQDIKKDTVDFVPNYNGEREEPTVLPTRFPNLLVNGSMGIAVGMATKIPPHNLGEIIDGLLELINNPDISLKELIEYIPGPDFPTGAFIEGRDGIISAYKTGKGSVTMKARAVIEKQKKGDKSLIVFTEIPYQSNKARIVEQIYELYRDKKISGISDIRDETDREGIRVVVELKKDENPEVVLNQIYKNTQMKTSFGIQMVVIKNNQPQLLNLKQMLESFLEFRKEVVTRRTTYELKQAEARAHILEGLRIALDNLDEVIELIKSSENPRAARDNLIARFELSTEQAQAILDMRLQRLTGLERDKIIDEYREILKTIARLKEILSSERLMLNVIAEELEEIRTKFGDERRTEIIAETTEFKVEDLIREEDMVVTISNAGYIKRNPISLYRSQHRGGRGKTGMTTKSEDFVEQLFTASTHNYLLFFTEQGRVHWLKVFEIPQAGRAARGKAIVNLLNLASGDSVATIMPLREFYEEKYILMATKNGVVKKTSLSAFSNPRSTGIIAITLDEDDRVICARLTDGNQDVFLGTKNGKAIRFHEEKVRDMGRTARGVKGITLAPDDEVVGMEILNEGAGIMTVTVKGFGKRTKTEDYRVQGRGGHGILTIRVTQKNGEVIGVRQVQDNDEFMLITSGGKIIRLRVADVSLIGRVTQGVKLINLSENEYVVSSTKLVGENDKGNEIS